MNILEVTRVPETRAPNGLQPQGYFGMSLLRTSPLKLLMSYSRNTFGSKPSAKLFQAF